TFAAWGTPTVKFHQCRGALSGLLAALLAEQKFLATREFLTAKDGGLYNSYTNGGKPERVTADLGRRRELEQIRLRVWPSASLLQGMTTALFDLLEQNKVEPGRSMPCAWPWGRPPSTCMVSGRDMKASSTLSSPATTRRL